MIDNLYLPKTEEFNQMVNPDGSNSSYWWKYSSHKVKTPYQELPFDNAETGYMRLKVITDLKPDDVIVWEIPQNVSITLDTANSFHEYLKEIFPNNKVITIYGTIKITHEEG